MSLTREAELALLVADQESDDTDRIYSRAISLDQQLGDDADSGTFHDLLGVDFFGEGVGITRTEAAVQTGPTDKDLAYWKYLRHKCKWSYVRIGARCGVSPRSVRYHIKKRYRRDSESIDALEAQFDVLKHTYERGARLIDIATEIYVEVGYASPQSCYQQLRILFVVNDVPRFRRGKYRHGMLARTATKAQRKAYWKEHWRKKSEQHRATLRKCAALTKNGNRCKRWSITDSDFCMNHGGNRRPSVWSERAILAALNAWRDERGSYPASPHEWQRAEDGHPSFKTVYDRFGNWPSALSAARLLAEGAA